MEPWNGSVLITNATCSDFGQKCLQLPGMLTLSHCDTTSYPYGTEYNMISGNYFGVTTLGDNGTTYTELMNALMLFSLHYMVSHQEHPRNLLVKIFSQRRRKILK